MTQHKKVWFVTGSASGLGRNIVEAALKAGHCVVATARNTTALAHCDFRKAFHTTPQKWLTQKRLELAHYQLGEKHRKPGDVYIEVGFENLSHFSFAFKKHFGYTPSELKAGSKA